MKSRPQVYIIAEAGVNHNGSLERAKQMVITAAEAGADAVKFQTFKADCLVTRDTEKAAYQREAVGSHESQFDMLKKLELDENAHQELIEICKSNRIDFLSTPFDLTTIDLLKRMGISKWKIPSGEITNLPYLRKIGAFNQPVLLSTGMADIEEIKTAVAGMIRSGTDAEKITILHCNTEYPTPMEDVNLLAMQTIMNTFPKARVGYSDHTLGIEVPVAAVAMGASVIEKHFTLDKTLPGPDHSASLSPDELVKMISAIRNIEKAMGDGIKKPTMSEEKNIPVVRKSIVAACSICKGEIFTPENLTVKRPGTGISPIKWDEILGRKALENYEKDDLIKIDL